MATIRNFDLKVPERSLKQGDAKCSIILGDIDGEKFLQLDSYGSSDRQFVGKRSQSMRLTKPAFDQLVRLGQSHFYGN
jgi:hypothetical protein